jgi:hypothetical protein
MFIDNGKGYRKYPWHTCGMCYFIDIDDMCNYYPEQVPVLPKRWGCVMWKCVICLGEFDDGDDHGECLHVVVELV